MDYKVLYRKYRPQNFDDLVGQNAIKELLLNSIINNKLSHAYLFTGPRGTGKTSTAKLFAKTINCSAVKDGIPCNNCISCISSNESTDIIEIDAASNNGVDEIRELRDNVKMLPTTSKYKVYIIDEVHMLSSSAWNAFLKTLEEPPSHVIFILATTEIQKVPITVLSRCQRFDFQKIDNEVIENQIKKIATTEKIKITKEAIAEVAKLADGALRDALSFLDQLSKLDTEIDLNIITKVYGIITNNEIDELLTNLNIGNVKEYIRLLNKFQENGVDPNILLGKLMDILLAEAINEKISAQSRFKNIKNIEELIIDLEKCYNRSNQYLLIKAILLKYISIEITSNTESIKENQFLEVKETEKEQAIETTSEKTNIQDNISKEEIISQEIISNEFLDTKEDINQELINIRVNNSYVEANINLKQEFIKLWEKLIQILNDSNELKYLSLIKSTNVEVVSPTNCLLSTEFYSNSVLFNSNLSELEEKLEKELNINKKLICLDIETWNKEKAEYLKNRKNKTYQLIEEPNVTGKIKVINSAETLFGNELIEVN